MRTILQIITIFIASSLLSCKSAKKEPSAPVLKASPCKPYFAFDKLEYYSAAVSDDDSIWTIAKKQAKTTEEKQFVELLVQPSLQKLSDTTLLNGIERLGFQKREIPKEQFDAVNEVFCERKHEHNYALTSTGFYQDILVFKLQSQVVGTAKISFQRMEAIIAGTEKNTSEFGQSGDYDKLYKLLHPSKECL